MAAAVAVTVPPNIPPADPSIYSDFDARSSPSEKTLSIGFRSSITLHNDDSSMTSHESPESTTVHRRRASAIDIGYDFSTESRRCLTDHVKQVELQRDMLRQTVASLLERQALQEQRHERKVRMLESELERMQMRYASRASAQRSSCVPDVKTLERKAEEMRQKARVMEEEKDQAERGLRSLEKSLETAQEERDTLRKWLQGHGIGSSTCMREDDLLDDRDGTNSMMDADREARRANEALIEQISEQLRTNEEVRAGLSEAITQNEEQRRNLDTQISDVNSKLKLLERAIDQAAQRSEEEWTDSTYEEHKQLLRQSHNEKLKRRSARGRVSTFSRDEGRRCSSDTYKSEGSRLLALLSPLSPSRDRFSDFLAPGPGSDVENAQLQARVRELENALREADLEMKTVVNRMNMAQIEVVELQADREHALRQLRKYQDHEKPQRTIEKPPRPASVQSRFSMFTISREPERPRRMAAPDEGLYYE
ncbi:hypothetical protein KEM56_006680 [Ascosphaera pollenicola]|nr:hypothetical protein KEM56_006680 [Ascosphaera pollenicola]